jgi:DNA-binding MarR family transcriptional regulator
MSDRVSWTFLSSHGNVIVYIDEHPDARLREIADALGITERSAHTIVSDLVHEGYLTRQRIGRRSRYTVNTDNQLRHPAMAQHTLGHLLLGMSRGADDGNAAG